MTVILGSDGLLGKAILAYYNDLEIDVCGINRTEFEVGEDFCKLADLLLSNKADVVINCIGVVVQVIDKYNLQAVYEINQYFPRKLADFCFSNNIRLIHVSTDCVFSGYLRESKEYNERALPDSVDLYGVSKFKGENPDKCLVVRTSFIGEEFRDEPRSFLGWVMSNKGKTVNGYTNHYWNGVTTIMLSRVLLRLSKLTINKGLLHIYSPQYITKSNLIYLYNRIYDLNIDIKPVEADKTIDRKISSIYGFSSNMVRSNYVEQAVEMKHFYDRIGR